MLGGWANKTCWHIFLKISNEMKSVEQLNNQMMWFLIPPPSSFAVEPKQKGLLTSWQILQTYFIIWKLLFTKRTYKLLPLFWDFCNGKVSLICAQTEKKPVPVSVFLTSLNLPPLIWIFLDLPVIHSSEQSNGSLSW